MNPSILTGAVAKIEGNSPTFRRPSLIRAEAYREFIDSREWTMIRDRKLREHVIQGTLLVRCEVSGIALPFDKVQAHHVTYPARWEDTKNHHLILVAWPLHKVIHDWGDCGKLIKSTTPSELIHRMQGLLRKWGKSGMPTNLRSEEKLATWIKHQNRQSIFATWQVGESIHKKQQKFKKDRKGQNKKRKRRPDPTLNLSNYKHIIRNCTTSEIMKMCPIIRATYWQIMKDPDQVNITREQAKQILMIANKTAYRRGLAKKDEPIRRSIHY